MDSDLPKAVEEELRIMVELISQQTAAISGMSKSIVDITGSVNGVKKAANTEQNSLDKDAKAVAQNNVGQTALQKNNERYRELTDQAIDNFISVGQTGKNVILSFATNVLSTQEGFAKYNNVIGGIGDAALDLGRNFGIVGTIIGGLFKGFSMVLQYQTQQADNIFKAYDSVARLGTAGTISSKEVMAMGRGAGLTSMDLDKLIDPMKSVRGGFVGLGGLQSKGIKIFGEAAAVSENVRKEFQRLGMGDKDRNQAIADFLSMMNTTGMAFSTEMQSAEGLQKAALTYTRQMNVLADVSGLTVEEAKKKYEMQMATEENALFQNKLKQDMVAAQKAYDSAATAEEREAASKRLEALKQKDAGYQALNKELMSSNLSQEQIVGMQRRFFTGYADKYSSQLDSWGVPVEKILDKARKNQLKPGEAKKEILGEFREHLADFGEQNAMLDKESAKNMGLGIELIKHSTQTIKDDYEKIFKDANDKIKDNQDGKGPVANDPAQIARNELTEAERKLRQKIDKLAEEYNPFLGNGGKLFEKLEDAAKGALGVLLLIVAFKAGKFAVKGTSKLIKRIRGTGGTKANAAVSAAAGAPKTVSKEAVVEAATEAAGGSKVKAAEQAVTKGMQIATEPAAGKIVKFLFLPVTGLASLGAAFVPIVTGAGYVGAAILAIGVALAAGSKVIEKATIPILSRALKMYDTLDGEKIQIYGNAMLSLGTSIAIATAGSFTGSLTKAVNFFTSMFSSDEDPLDVLGAKILKVQELDFNKKQLVNNTTALVMFASIMAQGLKKTAKMASAQAMQSATDAISGFFSNDLPIDQFKEFSKLEINSKAVKTNSTAFKFFAEALSQFKGFGSSAGAISSAIAESTARFFGVSPPLEEVVDFSKLVIDPKKTKNNAISFRLFSEAMSSYKGIGSGLGALSLAIGESVYKFYKGKPPVDRFYSFATLQINESDIKMRTKAFMDFVEAFSSYKPNAGFLDTISGLITGGSSYFSEGGALYKFEEFANMNFTKQNKDGSTSIDEGALSQYGMSIGTSAFTGSSPLADAASNLVDTGADAASTVFGKLADAASTAWDKAKGVWDSVKIHNVIKFTSQSGQYENFIALNPPMQEAVLAAATEYKQVTGNKLQMNSGRRKLEDQQRIYDTSVRNGTPGRQPNGRLVAKPNPNAPHIKGNAIDLQQGINDTARTNQILAKYNLKNKYGRRDLPHYDLYAERGGVFTGPGSGYPIELHGSEIVVPMNPNSVLMRLAQIPYDNVKPKGIEGLLDGPQGSINFELYNKISSQLDELYAVIDNTHDLDKKMLKHELF